MLIQIKVSTKVIAITFDLINLYLRDVINVVEVCDIKEEREVVESCSINCRIFGDNSSYLTL